MCLAKVDQKIDKPTMLIEDGWKKFRGSSAAPEFEAYNFAGSRRVPLDKWIAAEQHMGHDKKITANDGAKYAPGFHVYVYKTEAEKNHALRRVYYRRAHTIGRQDNATVAIAMELYVPTNPDAWPV